MSSFDIDVTRDGGCWTVHIREVKGPAQGRTISEAEWTARQMIALATGVPIDDIAVRSTGLAAQNRIPARWASSRVDPGRRDTRCGQAVLGGEVLLVGGATCVPNEKRRHGAPPV